MTVFTLRPMANTWEYLAGAPHAANVLRHAVELVAGGNDFRDLPGWSVPSLSNPTQWQPRYSYKLDGRCISIRIKNELRTVISGIRDAHDKIRKAIGFLLEPTICDGGYDEPEEKVTRLFRSNTWNKYRGIMFSGFDKIMDEFKRRKNGDIPNNWVRIDSWMERYLQEAIDNEARHQNLGNAWTRYVRVMIRDNTKSMDTDDWDAADVDSLIAAATKNAKDLKDGKFITYGLTKTCRDDLAMLYRENVINWILSKLRKIREELKEAGAYHYAV